MFYRGAGMGKRAVLWQVLPGRICRKLAGGID